MSDRLIIGATDPVVMWCLAPAVESACRHADLTGLRDVGLIVGSPHAEQWGHVQEMPHVVAIVGVQRKSGAYASPLAERADVLCLLEEADLHGAAGTATPCVEIGVPRPPQIPPPDLTPDARVTRIYGAIADAANPPDARTVSVVAGEGGPLSARIAASWQQGSPVVALADGPMPPLLPSGAALVATTTLVAYEALNVLARGAPLRRAVARRGRQALSRMPSTAEVASRILEAMVLASGGPDRTRFISA